MSAAVYPGRPPRCYSISVRVGWRPPGPSHGYQRKNVKRDGASVAVFVEVPEEQEVISLINCLYHEDGVAPAEIARQINDHGYTKRNGKRWDSKQVTRLIEDYDRVYNTTSSVVDKGIEFLKALP